MAKGKILRYPTRPPVPENVGGDDVESPTEFIDYISFRRYQIKYSDTKPGYYGLNLPNNEVDKQFADNRVYLAIPNAVQTSYQPQYNQVDLGVAGVAAAGLLGSSGNLDSIVNTIQTGARDSQPEFAASAIASAANNLGQMLGLAGNLDANSLQALTKGKVFNPFQEQIFKNMAFRTHNFNFKLFARNVDEAKEIYDIIQWMKIGSVPKIGGAGGFNPSSSPGNNPGTDGGATEILLNGSPALVLGGGSAGVSAFTNPRSGGSVSTPNLTRLPAFPSNNEATGGTGGGGAVRNGDSSDTGGNNSGRGTGGGGGGGANVSPRSGANGGDASGSNNSVTYNINQQGLRSYTFTNPFPIVVSGCAGTGSITGNLSENANGPATHPQDPNTGGAGKAGGGLKAVTAVGSPSDEFHGGGGGGNGGGMASSGPYPQANMKGAGGGGYIIVIGSSFELVSGVNF